LADETEEGEDVERTLTLKMRGKLRNINSYCEAIGEIANDYEIELEA